jgi:hypothetical protein
MVYSFFSFYVYTGTLNFIRYQTFTVHVVDNPYAFEYPVKNNLLLNNVFKF